MSWTGQSWAPEQPRFVADLTGNGKVDIVGFGLDWISVSLNKGDGAFQPPNMVLSAFSFRTGWQVERHPRFVADLTGDGRADILGTIHRLPSQRTSCQFFALRSLSFPIPREELAGNERESR